MSPIDQPGFNRRGTDDRRGAHDLRSPEERLRQGERRQGLDRRARAKRDAGVIGHNLLYAIAGVVVFCFADIRFFDGQHSMRVAVAWGEYAASTAEHWVGAGFGR
jgi:hypothetical protein